MEPDTIGKTSMLLVLAAEEEAARLAKTAAENGYRACTGQAGSMDFKEIVAAIETAAIREGLVSSRYWEMHALYHATLEAFHGICRGQLELGTILRTVGLRFAVVRGRRDVGQPAEDDHWIAVALYGTIGAPVKGSEHEVAGLGINHI